MHMADTSVFDNTEAMRINTARQDWIGAVLKDVMPRQNLRTCADIGCGVGHFAAYLAKKGLQVTGWDAREENVQVAGQRLPDLRFGVANVEADDFATIGQSDMVLCFGLLYHLENPFKAVRNLAAITGKTLLIESMVVPGEGTVAILADESTQINQGVTFLALIPSEPCLIKMLYQAGFSHVYTTTQPADYEDFRETEHYLRRRITLAASREALHSPILTLAPEPRQEVMPIWQKPARIDPLPVRAINRVNASVRYRLGRLRSKV
jgi:SAM-dependent methyltransferase